MKKLLQITSAIGIIMILFIMFVFRGFVRGEWIIIPVSYLLIYIIIIMQNDMGEK